MTMKSGGTSRFVCRRGRGVVGSGWAVVRMLSANAGVWGVARHNGEDTEKSMREKRLSKSPRRNVECEKAYAIHQTK